MPTKRYAVLLGWRCLLCGHAWHMARPKVTYVVCPKCQNNDPIRLVPVVEDHAR